MSDDAKLRIESYLKKLRGRLQGMDREDTLEIVEELRSHIAERAAAGGEFTVAGVEAALAALGSPEELASRYVTDEVLARAEVSRSPVRIVESLFRWASFSLVGFFVLLASIIGYFIGSVFMWCGVMKIVHPQTAGLWVIPDVAGDVQMSFRLGFAEPPPSGRDLLGWWIIPLGPAAGCGLVLLTTRFSLWCAGQYRKSHTLFRR
jgi:hypothetical protein